MLETSQRCVACELRNRSSVTLQKLSIISVQVNGWFSRVTHQRCQANPAGFVAYPFTANRRWTFCQLRNSLERVAG